jgi:xanthine dehydrogenase accessory factor
VAFLERLDDALPTLWLYGAGHVGQALARIVAELPLRLTWIDSRTELFPTALASEVRLRGDADSLATIADAPEGTYFLVMTHSHPLDYELCRAILGRNDFAWLGLIGSESKAARFRSRLVRDGVGADRIARLVCPIGVSGIESKWPAAIAVGVAAQLMQEISAAAGDANSPRPHEVANLPQAYEVGRPGAASLPQRHEVGRPGAANLSRGHEVGHPGAASLSRGALPIAHPGVAARRAETGECGQESCATCGTSRRTLE